MATASDFSKYINDGYTSKGGSIIQEEVIKSNKPSTAEIIGKSVTKVVTSATFIRGVFGVLNKLFRK